jgi:hypothetical protein
MYFYLVGYHFNGCFLCVIYARTGKKPKIEKYFFIFFHQI